MTSTDSALLEPQWFVTHHTLSKAGGREEFMKKLAAMTGMEEKALSAGFYRCALMATSAAQEGVDGPMFCVWETKAGTTASEMSDFLKSDCFPISDLMASTCHPIVATPQTPAYPVSKFKGDQFPEMPKPSETTSKFFVVHHMHKDKDGHEKFMKKAAEMSTSEMGELMEKLAAAGFGAHSSMHSESAAAETFCVWETSKEKTKSEMEALFDGPLFAPMNMLSTNTAYEIDLLAAGVPYPPKLKPESAWFITHHTKSKVGGRNEFMENLKKMTQTPEMAKMIEDVAVSMGFYRCAIMPCSVAQEGEDGPIFCIWEAKAGTATLEMKSFLDSSCFPINGLMSSACHPILKNPMAPPFPASKFKGEKAPFIPMVSDVGSKFFVLHHLSKEPGSAQQMIDRVSAMTPKETQEMFESLFAAGFAAHSSMNSTANIMETYCVWETSMDVKKNQMEALFDGPLFKICNGLFTNKAYEIDISQVGAPYPPKIACASPKLGGS